MLQITEESYLDSWLNPPNWLDFRSPIHLRDFLKTCTTQEFKDPRDNGHHTIRVQVSSSWSFTTHKFLYLRFMADPNSYLMLGEDCIDNLEVDLC